MLCSVCQGKHWVVVNGRAQPCLECGGLGEVYSCEGLQAEPEPATTNNDGIPTQDCSDQRTTSPFPSSRLAQMPDGNYNGRLPP